MFGSITDNLRYVWRSVGQCLRGKTVEELSESGVDLGVIEELILYSGLPDWENRDCPVELSIRDLCRLGAVMGGGLTAGIESGLLLEDWCIRVRQELTTLEVTRRTNCVVCRHPKLIEIELLLSRGMGLLKVAEIFKVSWATLNRHRDLCMGPRLARLQEAVGTVGDLSALVGTVAVTDRVLDLGTRVAEAALANGQVDSANEVVKTLLQGTELRGKLTGESSVHNEQSTGAGAGQGPANVPQVVLVVPQGTRPTRVIDVKGDSE